MAVQEMDDTAYLSQRNSGVLIKLLTPSASAELFRNLKTYFSPEKGIENIRHIPLAEHSFINCHIKLGDQGAISFDTPATVLKLRSKFLKGIIYASITLYEYFLIIPIR